jgi:adenylylsulfate kinase
LINNKSVGYFTNDPSVCLFFNTNAFIEKPGHDTVTTKTIWFTGLSGSGKSTLSGMLEQALKARQHACVVLDGDEMRKGLCIDLGFSAADRAENIRRIAEVAAVFNRHGTIAIVALISPMLNDRAIARAILGKDCMVEVHVSTPLAVCEARDPKGLYLRARTGLLAGFTGISAPYEAPIHPELVLDTALLAPEDCVDRILSFLQAR